MALQLYELCGSDPARVFSPFCWRSRMALAIKGLAFESLPWRFTEKDRLAFVQHDKVPVLVDGDRAIPESWDIAQHLDEAYPHTAALLRRNPAPYVFVSAWNDTVVQAGMVQLIVSDIPAVLDAADRAYFIESREKRFGKALAEVTADREARLPAFRASLQPLRHALRGRDFLGGATPDYADCIVFGSFMWARSISPLPVLAADDTLHGWRDRMLDLAGGMARQAPHFGA